MFLLLVILLVSWGTPGAAYSCLPWRIEGRESSLPVSWWLIIQGRGFNENTGLTYFDSTGAAYEWHNTGDTAEDLKNTVSDRFSAMTRTLGQLGDRSKWRQRPFTSSSGMVYYGMSGKHAHARGVVHWDSDPPSSATLPSGFWLTTSCPGFPGFDENLPTPSVWKWNWNGAKVGATKLGDCSVQAQHVQCVSFDPNALTTVVKIQQFDGDSYPTESEPTQVTQLESIRRHLVARHVAYHSKELFPREDPPVTPTGVESLGILSVLKSAFNDEVSQNHVVFSKYDAQVADLWSEIVIPQLNSEPAGAGGNTVPFGAGAERWFLSTHSHTGIHDVNDGSMCCPNIPHDNFQRYDKSPYTCQISTVYQAKKEIVREMKDDSIAVRVIEFRIKKPNLDQLTVAEVKSLLPNTPTDSITKIRTAVNRFSPVWQGPALHTVLEWHRGWDRTGDHTKLAFVGDEEVETPEQEWFCTGDLNRHGGSNKKSGSTIVTTDSQWTPTNGNFWRGGGAICWRSPRVRRFHYLNAVGVDFKTCDNEPFTSPDAQKWANEFREQTSTALAEIFMQYQPKTRAKTPTRDRRARATGSSPIKHPTKETKDIRDIGSPLKTRGDVETKAASLPSSSSSSAAALKRNPLSTPIRRTAITRTPMRTSQPSSLLLSSTRTPIRTPTRTARPTYLKLMATMSSGLGVSSPGPGVATARKLAAATPKQTLVKSPVVAQQKDTDSKNERTVGESKSKKAYVSKRSMSSPRPSPKKETKKKPRRNADRENLEYQQQQIGEIGKRVIRKDGERATRANKAMDNEAKENEGPAAAFVAKLELYKKQARKWATEYNKATRAEKKKLKGSEPKMPVYDEADEDYGEALVAATNTWYAGISRTKRIPGSWPPPPPNNQENIWDPPV